MPTTRRAQCSCGQLSATCFGEPVRLSVCHCLACKQRTGSAFGFNAWFPQQDVVIEGRATEFVRVGDEGGRITFRFCPSCGTTVYWNIDRIPGTIAVSAGSFADLAFPPPSVSVYESRRHPWVQIKIDQLQKNVRG